MMDTLHEVIEGQTDSLLHCLGKLKLGKAAWMFGLRVHPITGQQQMHNGIDLPAAEGAAIFAPADGVVQKVWSDAIGGLQMRLRHDPLTACGLAGTGYAHCYAIEQLKAGDTVTRGQPIARVGATGRATGPHLHLVFRRAPDGRVIDPLPMLLATSKIAEAPDHKVG